MPKTAQLMNNSIMCIKTPTDITLSQIKTINDICVIDQACLVKMAGYWPSSLFAFLCTETKSTFIKMQKKNEANIQPS